MNFRREDVRTSLRTPEEVAAGHDREFFHDDVPALERFWVCDVHGVGLVNRGRNDNHVCYVLLSCDDGAWSVSSGASSSYYIPELVMLLAVVNEWIETNCAPDMYDGRQYGWRFKP